MSNEKLLELIELQQKEIKCLGEQVKLLRERQDIHKDLFEHLSKNVLDLWEFVDKVLKVKKPKR